jgi:hypothetical protein
VGDLDPGWREEPLMTEDEANGERAGDEPNHVDGHSRRICRTHISQRRWPMKKVMSGLLVMGLLAMGAFGEAQEKKVAFSLNLGMQTNLWKGTSFDLSQGSLDVRAGIQIGRSFEVSPELMYVTSHKLHVDYGFLYPGVVLNYVTKNFFIGAGAVLPVVYGGGESSSGNPAPKVNVGYRADHLVLTAYIIMWTEKDPFGEFNFPKFNFIGATVGYRF